MKKIKYKGKVLETKHYVELTDEQFEEIKDLLTSPPTLLQLHKSIKNFQKGNNSLNEIKGYFFRDLMYKVSLWHSKWPVEDIFINKEIMGYFYAKSEENKAFYGDIPLKARMEKSIRNGKGVCSIVSNFPPKTVQLMLEKYNVNNHYYDFSCGWGVRLGVAMRNRVNYYGTDPNEKLYPRLLDFHKTYNEVIGINSGVDIRCQGSEKFVPEWEGKIGLAFTSPPYFALEDYKFGDQSVKDNTSYEDWLEKYMRPTIQNVKRYLIEDGVLAINIKGYNQYNLYDDTKQVCLDEGFVLVEEVNMEITNRTNIDDNSENIMILKKNSDPIVTHNSIDDLFE
jgi:hypothetical protein